MSAPPEEPREPDDAGPASDPPSELVSRLASRESPARRYRLEGEVARGGMGAILRVWDEDLQRHLAMKVVLGRGEGAAGGGTPEVPPAMLARFLEEAQVTGQLDHPGIVPVHELGVDAEGQVYFTMKLVQGETLEAVFGQLERGEGGWTQTRVLGLLLRVCEAMAYAHDKGVIHRDLKPANVMVGRFGEVYVMDWGLAKVLGRAEPSREPTPDSTVRTVRGELTDALDGAALNTMEGEVMGTPAYMSPEQAAGRVSEMDATSDVYALGAMLYRLLAGHTPYVARGERANNLDVWRAVKAGPPPPLHDEAPDVPAELVAICEKAMAREAGERYPSTSELADDLAAFVEGRVVRAYETGAWAEARKWVARNRPLAAALAAALLAVVVGGVGFAVKADQATRAAALARSEADRADEKTLEAERNRERAEAETAKVLRLSDVKVLAELVAEADALWPATPVRVPALEAWLERARALTGNLAQHRATLAEVRGAALGGDEQGGWRFATPEEGWQHGVLTELVADLEAFEAGLLADDATTPAHGWSVPKRLAFARRLRDDFAPDGAHGRAWQEALPLIESDYAGLALAPQVGLVPLGPDPESGLWEFAHLATGSAPERDVEGRLVLREESGVVLVLLPGDVFWMGAQAGDPAGRNHDPQAATDEGPVHEVELSPFLVSKYELTQAQWMRLTGANPSAGQPGGPYADSLLHPVEQVSWNACTTWLPRAGLTLPSEAQWEYAARAGTDTAWWTGAERESLRERNAANLADQAAARAGAEWDDVGTWPELDDGYSLHAPIGTFAANGFGLYEVAGNVAELCRDGYVTEAYARGHAVDPVVPTEGSTYRVARGGAFFRAAVHARSAKRDYVTPTDARVSVGVRPARALAD